MKYTIPLYDTYTEATDDLLNLIVGQVVSIVETNRLYRVQDGVEKSLVPITDGASYSLVGDTLTITV